MLYHKKNWAAATIMFCLLAACGEKSPGPASSQVTKPIAGPSNDRTIPSYMDKSPMDIIYFPVDYPVLKMSGKADPFPVARVIYSRPFKDGRRIFGNIVKYNAYWRLGANESTEIEFFSDVVVGGTPVKKGRYILYCIPTPGKWTLKLNSDLYTWGLRAHPEKDLYSFEVPVTAAGPVYEVFTMEFHPDSDGARLMIAWDSVKAYLPITF